MNRLATLLITVAVALACHAAAAATLYVAVDGNDANPGAEDRPFATLQRARDEIRQRKKIGRAHV
jgi:predicted porin